MTLPCSASKEHTTIVRIGSYKGFRYIALSLLQKRANLYRDRKNVILLLEEIEESQDEAQTSFGVAEFDGYMLK
jgi:hypothetical protein